VVAAVLPWFMALFGRDWLITSWMLLPLDERLAVGTLQTLAAHQGTTVDPVTEEQPGRILHEMRFGPAATLALGGRNIYYGTADATRYLSGCARHWADRAARLKCAFNEAFWLPDRGWYALGLDADKHPIDSLTSNIGHCLWTGIVDEDKAALVAEHLMSPEMFSGWEPDELPQRIRLAA
jgi:glycogen debranching enzyme